LPLLLLLCLSGLLPSHYNSSSSLSFYLPSSTCVPTILCFRLLIVLLVHSLRFPDEYMHKLNLHKTLSHKLRDVRSEELFLGNLISYED
jgi:hypothetical protein